MKMQYMNESQEWEENYGHSCPLSKAKDNQMFPFKAIGAVSLG